MTIFAYQKMLESYMGKTHTPKNFEKFWREKTAAAGGILSVETVDFENPIAVYEKMVIATEDHKVFARCIRPADAQRHPLVLMFHDLNRGVRGWHHMTRFIAQGYAVIGLDAKPDQRDWKLQPVDIDFEGRYTDALTLANIALAQPYVDQNQIVTWGEGWGAGLAMAVAAMLPGEVKCAALNPMPADFRGLCRNVPEDALDRLDYVDVANFAPLLQGRVLLGVCLMDEVAPPEGQYAAYNRLVCEKTMKLYPKYVHERVNFFENEVVKFLHD